MNININVKVSMPSQLHEEEQIVGLIFMAPIDSLHVETLIYGLIYQLYDPYS